MVPAAFLTKASMKPSLGSAPAGPAPAATPASPLSSVERAATLPPTSPSGRSGFECVRSAAESAPATPPQPAPPSAWSRMLKTARSTPNLRPPPQAPALCCEVVKGDRFKPMHERPTTAFGIEMDLRQEKMRRNGMSKPFAGTVAAMATAISLPLRLVNTPGGQERRARKADLAQAAATRPTAATFTRAREEREAARKAGRNAMIRAALKQRPDELSEALSRPSLVDDAEAILWRDAARQHAPVLDGPAEQPGQAD